MINALLALVLLLAADQAVAQTFAGGSLVGVRSEHPVAPAIFIVIGDDFGRDSDERYAGAVAAASTNMPALDTLAAEGARFAAFYTNANCAPTRASLFVSSWVPDNLNFGLGMETDWDTTVDTSGPEQARQAGAVVELYGKSGVQSLDQPSGGHWPLHVLGFTYWSGHYENSGPWVDWPRTTSEYAEFLTVDPADWATTTPASFEVNETGYVDTESMDLALARYAARDPLVPFIAKVGFQNPHSSLHWPAAIGESCGGSPHTATQCYVAMQEKMDDELGRLLAAVDQANTLVLFFSDNGSSGNVGIAGIGGKFGLGEHGIRVPAYVWGMNVSPGTTIDEPVNVVDVFPTLLDVIGAPVWSGSDPMRGYSFAELLGDDCTWSPRCWDDNPGIMVFAASGSPPAEGSAVINAGTAPGFKLWTNRAGGVIAFSDLTAYTGVAGETDLCSGDGSCSGDLDTTQRAAYGALCTTALTYDPTAAECPTLAGVPTGLACDPGDTELDCDWGAGANSSAFRVEYRCPSGSGSYTAWSPDPSANSLTITGLTNDVECDVRVAGIDQHGRLSAFTSPVQETPVGGGGSLTATFTGPCEVIDTNSDEEDDCYCTRVKGNGFLGASDPLRDSSVILCEDFDAPQLWDTVNHADWVGDGAPFYGPPYDGTGWSGLPTDQFRGFNGYLNRVWGNGNTNCLWPINTPASPSIGPQCTAGNCGRLTTVDGADPYQALGYGGSGRDTCINIITDGGTSVVDGADPWTGGTTPSGTAFGNAALEGSGAGNAWSESNILGHYDHNGSGTAGTGLGGNYTTLGVTQAVLFSANSPSSSGSSHGNAAQVKGDELTGNGSSEYLWGWQSNQDVPYTQSPYSGFVWVTSCPSGTVSAGDMNCSVPVRSWARTGWTRPGDFFGEWKCIRYLIEGMNTSSTRFRMWAEDSPDGSPIIDVTYDGTTQGNDYYNDFWAQWNFNNPTSYSEPISRGYDNIHVRGGHPVSCDQIHGGDGAWQ